MATTESEAKGAGVPPDMAAPAPVGDAGDGNGDGDTRMADAEPSSPATHKTSPTQPLQPIRPLEPSTANSALDSFSMRADPDAQATVSDYIDFVDHLPSDIRRSLTLIGKLDHTYSDASTNVDRLAATWSKLPTLPVDQRPAPVELRAEISENLNRSLSARTSSYAEATRMAEFVDRHVNRARTILSKLQTMRDKYPTEEQKSPVQTKSPQMNRLPKVPLRLDKDGQPVRRPPRITVPGEVLAPYEVDFNTYTSSDEGSSEEEESPSPPRISPPPRIKLVKTPKVPKEKAPKAARPPRQQGGAPVLSTSTALAKLQPPPENAVIGSADAPWLQLTQYELARLRKRMKKNAVWCPSDTMVSRELKNLGRGVEAYREAMKKAEEEGRPFEPALPAPIGDGESGVQHPPEGAISAEALGAPEVQLSNRGMKLNEAKKLKREALAKLAVEEAEESARKMAETARTFFNHEASPSVAGSMPDKAPEAGPSQPSTSQPQTKAPKKAKEKKRKRDSESEAAPEIKPEFTETTGANPNLPTKPPVKRTKTETPVPPPQIPRPTSVPPPVETPVPPPQVGQSAPVLSTTPVPLPVQPAQPAPEVPAPVTNPDPSPPARTSPVPVPVPPPTTTPTTTSTPTHTTTIMDPTTAPATATATPTAATPATTATPPAASPTAATPALAPATAPAPVPAQVPTSSPVSAPSQLPASVPAPTSTPGSTPAPTPAPTAGAAATASSPATPTTTTTVPTKPPAETPVPPPIKTSTTPILPPTRDFGKRETRKDQKTLQPPTTNTRQSSRANTPVTTPVPEAQPVTARRPVSRGKAGSQEPPVILAVERPRRASTARNTPAPPESRQLSKRTKRPAPGVVTSTAGGKSAVGSRKVPPKKGTRGTKKPNQPNQAVEQEVEVEVDDDGNVIDPEEPRYCCCNGVSFGTMIQCDNVDVSNTRNSSLHSNSAGSPAYSRHKTCNKRRRLGKQRDKQLTTPCPQNCKQEWFHLDCVGLSAIPARTTKWYCPECRVLLNIGGQGTVSSRGVKM